MDGLTHSPPDPVPVVAKSHGNTLLVSLLQQVQIMGRCAPSPQEQVVVVSEIILQELLLISAHNESALTETARIRED